MNCDKTNLTVLKIIILAINYNLTCQNGSLWLDSASHSLWSHSFFLFNAPPEWSIPIVSR